MLTRMEAKLVKRTFVGLLLGCLIALMPHSLIALESAEVLEVSRSGKSLILGKGTIGGLKLGMKAKFLIKSGTLSQPKLKYLAKGEVIKVTEGKSYWIIKDIDRNKEIKKGLKVSYGLLSSTLQGRRIPRVLQKKIIVSDSPINNSAGVPNRLVQESEDYITGNELVETQTTVGQDIETANLDNWRSTKQQHFVEEYADGVDSRFINQPDKVVSAKKIQARDNERIYDAQIEGVVTKTNNLPQGLPGLYREQAKLDDYPHIRKKTSIRNVYDQTKEQEELNKTVDPIAKRRIERDGERWSADFSDKELRGYMVRTGIEDERRRQELALTEKNGNEVILRFSQSLSNHTSAEDINNTGNNFSLLLGYELHLRRTSKALERWAIEFNLLRTVSNINLGGINGRFAGGTVGGLLNYYFYNNPASLDSYIWYLGTGLRRGNATVTSSRFNATSYDYSILGFPSFHVGMKYRFRVGDRRDEGLGVGIGLNALIGVETLTYSSSSDITDDNIEGNVSVSDLNVGFGVSFYF